MYIKIVPLYVRGQRTRKLIYFSLSKTLLFKFLFNSAHLMICFLQYLILYSFPFLLIFYWFLQIRCLRKTVFSTFLLYSVTFDSILIFVSFNCDWRLEVRFFGATSLGIVLWNSTILNVSTLSSSFNFMSCFFYLI